jgi:hypothetical protein
MLNWRSDGMFRREARWMFVLAVITPLVGLVVTILVPWVAQHGR